MNRPALVLAVVVASSIVAGSARTAAAAPNIKNPKPVHIHLELGPQMIQQAAAVLQSVLTPPSPPTPPTPPASQETTPSNSSNGGIVELSVPGFGDAVVSVPLGAKTPRPVMIAAHGRGLDPKGSCENWRGVFGDRHFILCPRGKPFPARGFTFDNDIGKEIDAGLVALGQRFGALVDPGPMIYMGYSQGAAFGPSVVMKNPARFQRVIMTEGGSGGWNEQAFAKAGGQRILFACGQASCANAAKPVVARFEKAKVGSKMRHAEGAGHVETGKVADAIKEEWAWLTAGDPRWIPLDLTIAKEEPKPKPKPKPRYSGSSV
jgi:predicted esterase